MQEKITFNIVLIAPEIPQNTGAIGRLCVCTNAALHLIRPLGFQLDETHLKRAGLDYWKYVNCTVYENWKDFLQKKTPGNMYFCSTKGKKNFYDINFSPGDWLVFGNEGQGLPKEFYQKYLDNMYHIPMLGEHARSHNLANSAAIVLYEALRQNIFKKT